MIPHIHTLFEFISIPYENQHQTLNKKNWPGPNQVSRVFNYTTATICIVTLTLEIWSWVKVMKYPLVMDNNCVKYYPDPTWQWVVMAQTGISSYVCTVTITSEIWPWVKVMTHPWVMDNNCVKYYPDPTWQWGVIARTPISSMCALWPWPWRYNLGSRSWHILGSWTTIVWNIIQIQLGNEELWPGHGFWVCVHCDLDLGDMTLGQGYDTSFGHRQ